MVSMIIPAGRSLLIEVLHLVLRVLQLTFALVVLIIWAGITKAVDDGGGSIVSTNRFMLERLR